MGKRGVGRPKKIILDDSDLVLTQLIESKSEPLVVNSRIVQIISGLAEIACTDQEIAAVLGVPRKTFEDFYHKNAWLEAIIEDRRDKCKASLRQTQVDASKERVKNSCRACGKIMILEMSKSSHVKYWLCNHTGYYLDEICPRCNGTGLVVVDAFLDECQYCGSKDVEHQYMYPDRTMLVWLGKQWLGQTDKVAATLTGDPNAPVVVSTLAEFVRNAAKKKKEKGD